MLVQILVLILLIAVNGVFSSSEIAFLSVNKIKLKQNIKSGNKKAIKIKALMDNPSSFLATIQIGITLAGFLASAFAAEAFADRIVESLQFLTISRGLLKTITVMVVTLILSYFTLVFGELVPKRLAMTFPERIAYLVVNFISVLMKVTYPFVWFLTKSTNIVMRILGIKDKTEEKLTEEEIKAIILSGKEDGAIEAGEKELIFNIFDFNDTEAYQIMTPKDKVVAVEIGIDNKDLMNVIRRSKFTRIPVYEGDMNNIIGILNIKNIIIYHNRNRTLDLKEIIHEPFFVNKNEKVDDVFRQMQKETQPIGIVMEHGNFIGVITMEDAIEEIVGNIFDEFDKDKA